MIFIISELGVIYNTFYSTYSTVNCGSRSKPESWWGQGIREFPEGIFVRKDSIIFEDKTCHGKLKFAKKCAH